MPGCSRGRSADQVAGDLLCMRNILGADEKEMVILEGMSKADRESFY